MKYALLIPLFTMLLGSCNTNGTDSSGENIETIVELTYKDNEGNNLLDPDSEGYYPHDNISIYYMAGGEKITPNGNRWEIRTSNEDGRYFLLVRTPMEKEFRTDGQTTTLIELQNGVVDTLTTQYESGDGFFKITKVWYNNTLRWEEDNQGAYFTVTKKSE